MSIKIDIKQLLSVHK